MRLLASSLSSWTCHLQQLSQSKAYCLSVEEVVSSQQQWVSAVVREEARLTGVPSAQPAWGTSDSCFGRLFHTSLQLCRILHACRAALQGFSQLEIPQFQLVYDQLSGMAGMQGHEAGEMLRCGPEWDCCTGKSPKNISLSKILMSNSIIWSHSQICEVSSSEIAICWGKEVESSASWPWSFRLTFSCGFSLLPLPVPCCVPREGSVLALVVPIVCVNRGSLLLTLVHKPSSLLKVFICINKAYF